jgi:hypothetical protein
MKITADFDVKEAIAGLDDVQKRQVPFATALALTRTAQKIKAAEIEEMKQVFDRPTKFTLNSLFMKKATKKRLEAVVWFRDFIPKGTPAGKYLQPQIHGGTREAKRSEQHLRNRGILGRNQYLAPSRDAKLDRYGNISRGQIVKMLSQLRAQFDPYQNTVSDEAKKRQRKGGVQFFAMRRAGKFIGIWQRTGSGISPFLVATRKAPQYKPIFKFFEIGQKVAADNLRGEFDKAIEEALRTAN